MDSARTLAASPFPDDDGQASAETREALAEAAGSPTPASYLRAVAALCLDRVLVPVVATATRTGGTTGGLTTGGLTTGGLTTDKEADMAVVLLQTADGRRAMLAFTGLDALQAWSAEARPVPVTLDLAAKSAEEDGAEALLVDVAGPYPLVLEGEVLTELARGHRLVVLDEGFGWVVAQDPFPGLPGEGG